MLIFRFFEILKHLSGFCPTLKCCNSRYWTDFGIFWSESFGPLLWLFHYRIYFPDALRATTSKVTNPMPLRLGAAWFGIRFWRILVVSQDFTTPDRVWEGFSAPGQSGTACSGLASCRKTSQAVSQSVFGPGTWCPGLSRVATAA